MKFIVTAPTRCGLMGGGTDVNPFATKYGGKILSIALNLRVKAELIPHTMPSIQLESLGEKRTLINFNKKLNYGKDPKFDLIRAVINYFHGSIPSGFYLKTSASAENLMGLGASGATAVAIINAFNCWLKNDLSPMEIALLASRLETEELGWPGGRQDQLAASFGGINLLIFGPGAESKVIPQKFAEEKIKKLRDWSIIFFVGGYRHSKEQQALLVNGMLEKEKTQALINLRNTVDKAIGFIKEGDLVNLGKTIHLAWQDKKKSNPVASNNIIDDFYETALKLGALGGKIMGSGGAGNLFFIAPPEKHDIIKKTFIEKGARPIDFDFDFNGAIIETLES